MNRQLKHEASKDGLELIHAHSVPEATEQALALALDALLLSSMRHRAKDVVVRHPVLGSERFSVAVLREP